MWTDNEADRDFLNFGSVADTVGEIIVQADGRPVSIGVSGAWGVGKSSLIKLIRQSLESREAETAEPTYIFVEFNAWLYQGYDDARAALLDVIASTLQREAESRKKGIDAVADLVRRVNWLRVARVGVQTALPLVFGLPPVGLVTDIAGLARKVVDKRDAGDVEQLVEKIEESGMAAAGFLRPKNEESPPKEIQAIRDSFVTALEEMDCRLVVLIDDLDRCLPPTTISTLEAIRLFLFLDRTAFVIAADDAMIRHAVRQHFDGLDDKLLTSYFDKLIQVPIRVPPLGTQEVRAYLMMLYVDDSTLEAEQKEDARAALGKRLANTWRGERVDREVITNLGFDLPAELVSRLETAERLAPLMTSAPQIAGNPRLVKRFLNAVAIRMAISRAHGVGVSEAALAKMLLFERCGDPLCYSELLASVNGSEAGTPDLMRPWEKALADNEEADLTDKWDDDFVRSWLALSPPLADLDLRGIVYVSREHAPLMTTEDRLSSDAAGLLKALLENPAEADGIADALKALEKSELSVIMGRLLVAAQTEQTWGAPPILKACVVVARAELSQGSRIAAFLIERAQEQLSAAIVPAIEDEPWAAEVFSAWKTRGITGPVLVAIDRQRG